MAESNVRPIRTIQERVTLVLRKWEGLDRAREKHKSARLDVALELKELRDRVEAGEAGELVEDWWEWYGVNIKRSRGDAEKLLAFAEAENPQAAYEAARDYNTERRRLLRSIAPEKPQRNQSPADVGGAVVQANFATPIRRAAATVPRYVTGPRDEELRAQVMIAFRQLSWNGIEESWREQMAFVDRKHRGLE